MDNENIKNLNLIFRSLPESIKDWLTSPEVSEKFSVIISRANLKEDQELALSRTLLGLVTQHLSPDNFTNEISKQLSLDESSAKEIAKDIEEKILKPITNDLLIVGVDLKLLHFNTPSFTAKPIITPPTKEISAGGPFILHEEKEERVSAEKSTGPSFIFKDIPNNRILEPTKITVERVVHYSNFYTPLNQAPLKYHKKVKIPKSKWFI